MQDTPETAAPLVDPFERRIRYLRISVTDRCNFRCFYCMPSGPEHKYPRKDVLRFEEITHLARIMVSMGVEKLRVTGGEPLHRKGVSALVRELAGIPGLRDLAMTTNGLLLSRFARELRDSGLRRVNVSLDSLRPERFLAITGRDGLAEVLAGIEAALESGLQPVKLNVVVMRGINDDEIPDLAALACDRPLHVRFLEYMPFGAGAAGYAAHFLPSGEVLARLRGRWDLEPLDAEETAGPARSYRIPGAPGTLGLVSPIDTGFCHTCNRVRLTATGKLRLCLFSEEGLDLSGPLRDGESDARIAERIREALRRKPERHHLDEGVHCTSRPMSQVGG